MNTETILRLNDEISKMNAKQQVIARSLSIDSNFQIFEKLFLEEKCIVIKDISSGKTFLLLEYVKSKCNC